MHDHTRVRALRLTSFCVIALGAAASHSAEPAIQIARNTYLVRGEFPDRRQPDGNSILLLAPRGIVVIDTGRHVSHTQRIVEFAGSQRRDVAAIVNSHWHLDHIGGNALLRESFPAVTVYASGALAAARQGFLRDYRMQLEKAIAEAEPTIDTASWRAEMELIDAGDKLAPDHVIDTTQTLQIAGRPLTLHVERRAVTAADLWIEDRATNIIFAGDLVTLPVPFFDTACVTEWSFALKRIAERPFATLVPGHGAPMTRRQFDVYRNAFENLVGCSAMPDPTKDRDGPDAAAQPAGQMCIDRWVADLGTLLDDNERKRVGPMLDYYLRTLLRSPARNKNC